MRSMSGKLVTTVLLALCCALFAAQSFADVAASGSTPVLGLIPRESFAAIPAIDRPELSPDGGTLAMGARRAGKNYLYLHDVLAEPSTAFKPRLLPLNDATVNWIKWLNDRYMVVSVRSLEFAFGAEVPFDRLFLVSRDASTVARVGPQIAGISGDDVIYWASDGSYVLLNISPSVFSWPDVLKVELPSNKMRKVATGRAGIWRWFANSRGVVVAGVGARPSGYVRVVYRESVSEPFQTILRRQPDTQDDDADPIYFAHIDGDTQKAYTISRRGGDRWGVHEYDLRSKAFGAAIFAHDKFDVSDLEIDREGRLRWIGYFDYRYRRKYYGDEDRGFVEDLERAVPGKVAEIVSESRDHKIRIVKTSSPTDPGTYYLYRDATGTMQGLASVNEALAAEVLAPTEYVAYPARDGLQIPAYLTMPVGRKPANLPLIMLPHGGPFVRDTWGYEFLVQFLASRGYVVLQPNYRGSTGYGKAFEEAGYRQFGKAMQDDLDDGVRWLIDSGMVDAQRVCMIGWSYGGYAAQVASYRNPGIYRCAISIAGVSDLLAQVRFDSRFMSDSRFLKHRARIRGNDSSRTLNDVSPLRQVNTVAVPLLLIHGTDDNNVPVKQSDSMASALKKAGKPFEYVRIKDGDHSLWDPGQRENLLAAVERHLATYNPSDVLAASKRPGN